jgi:hypothetical protein
MPLPQEKKKSQSALHRHPVDYESASWLWSAEPSTERTIPPAKCGNKYGSSTEHTQRLPVMPTSAPR